MSYEYITDHDAFCYGLGRGGYDIKEIVIHHWGAEGQTFEGVCAWFENPACQTSAHYVVEAGRVACLVDLCNTAFHAGDYYRNQTSIGIECRPEMSDEDLETVCELVADLYNTYGVKPICGHKDIVKTKCPGKYYEQLNYIKQRAIEIMNGSEAGEDVDEMALTQDEIAWLKRKFKAEQATTPSDWAIKEVEAAKAAGITDGSRPLALMTREECIAMIWRLASMIQSQPSEKE